MIIKGYWFIYIPVILISIFYGIQVLSRETLETIRVILYILYVVITTIYIIITLPDVENKNDVFSTKETIILSFNIFVIIFVIIVIICDSLKWLHNFLDKHLTTKL